MNNTTIIKIFNSDNRNFAYTKIQNCYIMATIAYRILKFESMIKIPVVANHLFFTSITFSRVNSFTYISFIVIQYLKDLIFKKIVIKIICHFFCLELYKHNCLNILGSNICFRIQLKNE